MMKPGAKSRSNFKTHGHCRRFGFLSIAARPDKKLQIPQRDNATGEIVSMINTERGGQN
ncbi:hypothetical protein WN51_11795 [Melipona quadrifasciata]|uniref:Uncharacterized protein n=1 Tax=Melipona quadrifasciata TaxID=166423 RepID=A0A0M9A2R2_9HYME|nr:hypothetical protein WN51_11795 [Melipona quadrifasciata]